MHLITISHSSPYVDMPDILGSVTYPCNPGVRQIGHGYWGYYVTKDVSLIKVHNQVNDHEVKGDHEKVQEVEVDKGDDSKDIEVKVIKGG